MAYSFTLEFSEKQQCFHYNTGEHKKDTNGWLAVYERCTQFKWEVFEAFLFRVPQKKLTNEYVLECASEVDAFINNLSERYITISQGEEILQDTIQPQEGGHDDVFEPSGYGCYVWNRGHTRYKNYFDNE